ncbi:MAG TPA: hypothetical protein VGW40_02850 [Allosphingosinicella sp.]|nr:hypothetical protein [Allosphingosinicella sp.]
MIRFPVSAKDCLDGHEIELRRVLTDEIGIDLNNPHGFAILTIAEVDQLIAALYCLRTIIRITQELVKDDPI